MEPLPRMSLLNVKSYHFKQLFRMEKATFEKLLNRLAPYLTKEEGRNRTVQPDTALMACLMELAGGSPQWQVARAAGISQSVLSRRIDDFLLGVETEMTAEFLGWYRNREEREAAALYFYQKSKFRDCLGVIDGTHVAIRAPSDDEPSYVNRKGDHSINVQFVAGSEGRIRNIYAKWCGASHDSFVWQQSNLCAHMRAHPSEGYLIGDTGYVILF